MKVAILTEGLVNTGYGHITRCLSIYQAFDEQGIKPEFIINLDESGKKFLEGITINIFDWCVEKHKLMNLINDMDIVIIDSYKAPLDIYAQISDKVRTAVYLDDYLRINYPKGVIVNGTIDAESIQYRRERNYAYLLGTNYIPLRKEFWDIKKKNSKEKIKNILITIGGSDIKGITFLILDEMLKEFPNINYHVVLNNNHIGKSDYDNYRVKFYYTLSAQQMLILMLNCDFAISSAGQTSYELNRACLPCVLIGVIENQKYNLMGWKKLGYITEELWEEDENLGEKITNEINNYNGSTNQKNILNKFIVDGQGARRVVKFLTKMQSNG